MAENQPDELDFDSMLEDCAQDLNTKLTLAQTQPATSSETGALQMTVKDSESEPAPLKEIPQMHVQDFAQVPNNVGAEGKKNDEEEKDNVEDALKDFQNTLKEVLSDDKGAENAMQSMEQMMQFLKQNIEEAESKDGTA